MNWKVLPLAALATLLIMPAVYGMLSWLYPTTPSVSMMIVALIIVAVLFDVAVTGYHRKGQSRGAGGMMALNAILLYLMAVRVNTLQGVASGTWADYAAALVLPIAYLAIRLPRVERLPLLITALCLMGTFGRLYFAAESKVPDAAVTNQMLAVLASVLLPILLRLVANRVGGGVGRILKWVYHEENVQPPAQQSQVSVPLAASNTGGPPPLPRGQKQRGQKAPPVSNAALPSAQPTDTDPSLVSVVVRWALRAALAVAGIWAYGHVALLTYAWSSRSFTEWYWGGPTIPHTSVEALICWVLAGATCGYGSFLNTLAASGLVKLRRRTTSALLLSVSFTLAMACVIFTVQAVEEPRSDAERAIVQRLNRMDPKRPQPVPVPVKQ